MWAYLLAAILLTANYEGPWGSLMQQPMLCLMGWCKGFICDCFYAAVGQCKLIVQYHSTMIPCKGIEHKNLQATVGKLNLIGKAMTSSLQANVTTLVSSFPANCTLWRPTWQSCAALNFVLDGPIWASCANIAAHEMGPHKCLHPITFRLLWASAS